MFSTLSSIIFYSILRPQVCGNFKQGIPVKRDFLRLYSKKVLFEEQSISYNRSAIYSWHARARFISGRLRMFYVVQDTFVVHEYPLPALHNLRSILITG